VQRSAALAVLMATGCSPGASDSSDGGAPVGEGLGCLVCVDAQSDATILQKVEAILGSICANPDGCHGGGSAGRLGIASGTDFSSLIDVPSYEMPGLLRVKPGDPAHSYVYLKLACDGGIDGSCMPGGRPDPSVAAVFYDWIEAGAPTQ
jgi:hypothetical protein